MKANQYQSGFTLLEMIIVGAVLAILLTVIISRLIPPRVRLLSNEIIATIHQARLESVKRNRAVAILFFDDRLEMRVNTLPQGTSCAVNATELIRTTSLMTYGPARVTRQNSSVLPEALYWLPSGQARHCNGGFYARTLTVTAGNRSMNLVSNAAGRFRMAAP
jgi:prepilin-type N-terminal cleavage/methylation domain-containing protein